MRMQVGRAVAAVVVVGAVISGCGGPTQAGTAVFVGDQAVPLESVQSRLDAALARTDEFTQLTAQGGTAADLARIFATRQVMHELLVREAAAQGIVITEAQVDEQLAQRDQASANGSLGVDSFLEGPALRETRRRWPPASGDRRRWGGCRDRHVQTRAIPVLLPAHVITG